MSQLFKNFQVKLRKIEVIKYRCYRRRGKRIQNDI